MKVEKVLIFFMVLSIFLDNFIFGGNDRLNRTFDFYYYYLIFLMFLAFFIYKTKTIPSWPPWFLRSLLAFFVASFIAGYLSNKLKFPMLKQMIGIVFSSISYFALLKYLKFDVKKIFELYLKIAFWVALYGIAEEALQLAGFHDNFGNSKRVTGGFYRVYSIMGEPYFLAVALIPAVYYYLNKLIGVKPFRDRKVIVRASTITACYIFTFSSAGYMGLALMIVLIAYNHKLLTPTSWKSFVFAIALLIVVPNLNLKQFSIKEVQVRILDSFMAFASNSTMDKASIAKLNSSTFALYSNYLIAQKSFKNNPILGSGLGSHELTYDEYFESLFGKKFLIMYGMFNAKDGNSLFIRMMSETGILGLVLFFIFIFKFFLGRRYLYGPESMYLTIINQGILVVFVIRLVRTGNYIGQGFFLFFFIYYITNRMLKSPKTMSSLNKA